VEIIGATLPDIKLKHQLFHKYDYIGFLLALSNGISIIGFLIVYLFQKCFKTKTDIFCQWILDFIISISFFISTAGKIFAIF
jgi:hypothetical protein